MTIESALVLDASVGVKVVLPEEGSEAARTLFAVLLSPEGPGALVPDLFFPECANALRRATGRRGMSRDLVDGGLGILCELGLEAFPGRHLVGSALQIAREDGVSVYDAVYVALSDRTGAPLVTADRPLFDRLRGTRHRVRWLGEFAPEATPPGV